VWNPEIPILDLRSAARRTSAAAPSAPVLQEWLDAEGRLVASGGAERGGWWMHWPGLGTFHFGEHGPVAVDAHPGSRQDDLVDSFQRGVLPVALLGREYEALHASALLTPAGVVAFCARSGTGKSSLARGLASGQQRQWADDTVVFRVNEQGAQCAALPFEPRLDAPASSALSLAQDDDGHCQHADPPQTAPLRRVYFLSRHLRMDPAEPLLTRLAPAAGFERLLAHAHPFDLAGHDRRRRMIERLLATARTVTMFELRFAPSLAFLPSLVARVSDHVSTS
jgi:hypothetical protein